MRQNHLTNDELRRMNTSGIVSQPMLHHNSSGINMSGPGQAGQHMNSMPNSNGVAPNVRVFVQRDYRLGVSIRFSSEFPPELNGRIDQNAYEFTMNQINSMFEEAEDFNCSTFCESVIGFVTANLLYVCKDTRYERCLKKVSKFVGEQNQRVYQPRGLLITDPVDRGLRCIEIVILNDQSRS